MLGVWYLTLTLYENLHTLIDTKERPIESPNTLYRPFYN